jgi:membrane-bound ClpP family serine protease
MFLMGPAKQCKNMFSEGRLYATLTYLGAIAATLAVAFTLSGVAGFALVIVFLVIQFIAFAYYAMTYIPGGVLLLLLPVCDVVLGGCACNVVICAALTHQHNTTQCDTNKTGKACFHSLIFRS